MSILFLKKRINQVFERKNTDKKKQNQKVKHLNVLPGFFECFFPKTLIQSIFKPRKIFILLFTIKNEQRNLQKI